MYTTTMAHFGKSPVPPSRDLPRSSCRCIADRLRIGNAHTATPGQGRRVNAPRPRQADCAPVSPHTQGKCRGCGLARSHVMSGKLTRPYCFSPSLLALRSASSSHSAAIRRSVSRSSAWSATSAFRRHSSASFRQCSDVGMFEQRPKQVRLRPAKPESWLIVPGRNADHRSKLWFRARSKEPPTAPR
jgi:hypothetical protein